MRTCRQRILLVCGWSMFALSLLCIMLMLPLTIGFTEWFGWFSLPRSVAYLCTVLMFGGIFSLPLSVSLIYISSLAPSNGDAERLCPHCGYDLRGNLTTAMCPECGRSV